MAMNVVSRCDDRVRIRTMLVSVSDKTALDEFIGRFVDIIPDLVILSTGGTYNRLQQVLGDRAGRHLHAVSDYTGQPETQGGLVKTLDFKIYLGLLTEPYNPAHQSDLKRTHARVIDMVVVNLYPFSRTIAQAGVTPEQARGNVDIGGPTLIRAAAKNFIRVASVTDPSDYESIGDRVARQDGCLTLADRYALAAKAFAHTAAYDRTIADYLARTPSEQMVSCYQTGGDTHAG